MTFFKSLAKSFYYAFRGLAMMIKKERNFRIHITVIFYVVLFAFFYGLDRTQTAVLVLTFFTVPSLEIVNTAIEKIVDLKSPGYNRLAGIIKDISAASVLFASITAVVVGLCLFGEKERFLSAIRVVFTPPWLIIIAVSLVPAYLFVSGGIRKKRKNKITEHKKTEKV